MNKLVHIAWMSRWNSPNTTHGYITGVFDNIETCEAVGKFESDYRGNKYSLQRFATYIDNEFDFDLLLTDIFPLLPEKVIISIVSSQNRQHIVGAYSTLKAAKRITESLYHNWKIEYQTHPVVFTYTEPCYNYYAYTLNNDTSFNSSHTN